MDVFLFRRITNVMECVFFRLQHPDGGSAWSERAVRGSAHQTQGPPPVSRQLPGAGTRQLPAHRQVG